MSAPVFVAAPDTLAAAAVGGRVTLDGAEARHAVSVVRLRVGESLDLVDGRGRRVSGVVADLPGRDTLVVSVMSVTDEPQSQPRVVVVQALAKGDRGELAVEQLTEIGIDEIVPWSAAHCVVQWKGDRAQKSEQRWRDALTSAAKQSRRARFPELAPLATTAQVADRLRAAELAVVLHEDGREPVGALRLPPSGTCVIVVGPEGGIAPDELTAFAAAGATVTRLGPTVLRTSSAGLAAAAALLAGSDRWRMSQAASAPPVEG